MLGGRILGEGADGCILEKPGWPCVSGSKGVPEPYDTDYVSKIVPLNDVESKYLKLANEILGHEIASKYLASLDGECKPADRLHPPSSKDMDAFSEVKADIRAWKKTGQSCDRLKRHLEKGSDITKDNKIMFIRRYQESVSDWVDRISSENLSYKKVVRDIERAVPQFLTILQKLYQGPTQLIHMDLHTGNIFIKEHPFEFGIADFGHCAFRQHGVDPSMTFYGEYLINNVAKFTFYDGHYSQVPFESCLLNYCFKKHMEVADPYTFIQSWSTDAEVRQFSASSSDAVFANKDSLLKVLLKRPLFLMMLESLQSICRKLRRNPETAVQSLTTLEKSVIEFILTRYHAISPFNTISEDIANVFQTKEITLMKKFVLQSVLAPYEQTTSLSVALKSIQEADMGILWSDIVSGKV